jgi:hypothetical protein
MTELRSDVSPNNRRRERGPVTVTAAQPLPRRRPVLRHPGIYYRPRRDGKVTPPYEIRYLDSSGKHRWEVVHGNLEVAEARRAELRLRRTARRADRAMPADLRAVRAEVARAPGGAPTHARDIRLGTPVSSDSLLRAPTARPDQSRRRRCFHRPDAPQAVQRLDDQERPAAAVDHLGAGDAQGP